MDIGIGLPNPIPGTKGGDLIEWARRAEGHGFSTLATIDRIVYPSYESLIALAGAAAVTTRVELLTNVLLGPTRNPVMLAKEAASVDALSGGRLTLGVGVGGREDDFAAVGLDFHTRGRRWHADLEVLQAIWRGEPVAGTQRAIGPAPVRPEGIPLVIGGMSEEAVTRTVRFGVGWAAGGGPIERAAPQIARVREAWQAAGRAGTPRIYALAYFALGPDTERGAAFIHDYYGGPYAAYIAQALIRTPEAARAALDRYAAAGVTTLVFDPTIADPAQVDLLAEAVLK